MAHCYLFQRTNLLYLPKHVRNIRSSFQFSGVIFISNVRDSNIIIIHTDENDYNFEFDSRIVNFYTCVRCVCGVFCHSEYVFSSSENPTSLANSIQ